MLGIVFMTAISALVFSLTVPMVNRGMDWVDAVASASLFNTAARRYVDLACDNAVVSGAAAGAPPALPATGWGGGVQRGNGNVWAGQPAGAAWALPMHQTPPVAAVPARTAAPIATDGNLVTAGLLDAGDMTDGFTWRVGQNQEGAAWVEATSTDPDTQWLLGSIAVQYNGTINGATVSYQLPRYTASIWPIAQRGSPGAYAQGHGCF